MGKRCFDDKNDLMTIFSAMRNGFLGLLPSLRPRFPSHRVMRDASITRIRVQDCKAAHGGWLPSTWRSYPPKVYTAWFWYHYVCCSDDGTIALKPTRYIACTNCAGRPRVVSRCGTSTTSSHSAVNAVCITVCRLWLMQDCLADVPCTHK